MLRNAFALEQLLIGPEPSEPLVVEELPKLRRFMGVGANAATVAGNPSLESLELELRSWPEGLVVAGPVEYLHLSDARNIRRLPELTHPLALTTIRVHYAREFDLASLLPARRLDWIYIAPCPTLLNCDALLRLESLGEVMFSGVRRMPRWEALEDVRVARRFILDDQYVVPSDFGRKLEERPSNRIHISPKTATQDERARRRFEFNDDGEDTTTFSPFTVQDADEMGGPYILALDTTTTPFSDEEAGAIIESHIRRIAPRLLRDNTTELRVAVDAVYLSMFSLAKLEKIARGLAELWRNPGQLSQIALILATGSNGDTRP